MVFSRLLISATGAQDADTTTDESNVATDLRNSAGGASVAAVEDEDDVRNLRFPGSGEKVCHGQATTPGMALLTS